MATQTVSATNSVASVADLDRLFSIDDRQQVHAYLARHSHLVPLLVDAAAAIRRYFPQDDTLRLEVIDDAETKTEQLYAIVRTSLPSDEAERQLDRLDEEWWLDAVERASGELTIDAESR